MDKKILEVAKEWLNAFKAYEKGGPDFLDGYSKDEFIKRKECLQSLIDHAEEHAGGFPEPCPKCGGNGGWDWDKKRGWINQCDLCHGSGKGSKEHAEKAPVWPEKHTIQTMPDGIQTLAEILEYRNNAIDMCIEAAYQEAAKGEKNG